MLAVDEQEEVIARTKPLGDTDQIKAVATGECGIAVTNTYYVARMRFPLPLV